MLNLVGTNIMSRIFSSGIILIQYICAIGPITLKYISPKIRFKFGYVYILYYVQVGTSGGIIGGRWN